MPLPRRLITVGCFVLVLVLFGAGPRWLGHAGADAQAWMGYLQICCTLLATGLGIIAMRRSGGAERRAWANFATGAGLYFAGNIFYLYVFAVGFEPSFPTVPEALFFAMAIFFATGLYQYGDVTGRIGRIQVYNFILIYCAIITACLFLLGPDIGASTMPPFATIVAFAYPALWFSVAAFGVISLTLYKHGDRTFALALLVCAVLAEAAADLVYARELMGGSYQLGGLSQVLWATSAALIVCAACEQIALTRHARTQTGTARQRDDQSGMQAAVPAAAIAIFMLAGSISGAMGQGPFYVGFSAVLAVTFALAAGLREHWIIRVRRQLHGAVEASRAELSDSRRRLMSVLQSTSDSVIVVNREWRIEFFNERAAETIARPDMLRLGGDFWQVFPVGPRSEGGAVYRAALESRKPVEIEELVAATGTWLAVQAYPTEDGLSIFFRDISERRRVREEIAYLAHHDPLTGLANRVLFRQRLQAALSSGAEVVTVLLDLDHFKEINDSLGHAAGDTLLSRVAHELRDSALDGDTIARLGGDEFAIICVGHRDELHHLAQRILAAVAVPHSIDGQTVQVAGSAGIVVSRGQDCDPDDILRNADIALYEAKTRRGEFLFFEPAMKERLLQRQALRTDLAAALRGDQFELVYQPIVDTRTKRVSCFEALLRWHHPIQGTISPEIFIPVAEESGLIVDIGDWILRTACTEAVSWPEGISVAINLSTCQFASPSLPHSVERALAGAGLEPGRLELEITESVLLADSTANVEVLRRFREIGAEVALDDFGTGYSALGYLQKFQFNKLKIDRSFIQGLPENEESRAIVRAVTSLSRSLGMRVTAEGVETQAQYDWIAADCDEAQGFLISRPVAASEIPGLLLRLLADNAPNAARSTTPYGAAVR